jgi:hypothetical protein
MEMLLKLSSEAADISKPGEIDLSMVAACLTRKVEDCGNTIAYPKHVVHIGISLSTALASSTSRKVQTF